MINHRDFDLSVINRFLPEDTVIFENDVFKIVTNKNVKGVTGIKGIKNIKKIADKLPVDIGIFYERIIDTLFKQGLHKGCMTLLEHYFQFYSKSDDSIIQKRCIEFCFKRASLFTSIDEYKQAIASCDEALLIGTQDELIQINIHCLKYHIYQGWHAKGTDGDKLKAAEQSLDAAKAISVEKTNTVLKRDNTLIEKILSSIADNKNTPKNNEMVQLITAQIGVNQNFHDLMTQTIITHDKLMEAETKTAFDKSCRAIITTLQYIDSSNKVQKKIYDQLKVKINNASKSESIDSLWKELQKIIDTHETLLRTCNNIKKKIPKVKKRWEANFFEINKAKQNAETAFQQIYRLTKAADKAYEEIQSIYNQAIATVPQSKSNLLKDAIMRCEAAKTTVEQCSSEAKEALETIGQASKKADNVSGFVEKREAIDRAANKAQTSFNLIEQRLQTIKSKLQTLEKRFEQTTPKEMERIQQRIAGSKMIMDRLNAASMPTKPASVSPPLLPVPQLSLKDKVTKVGIFPDDLKYILDMQDELKTDVVLTGPFATYLALAVSKHNYSIEQLQKIKVEQINLRALVEDPKGVKDFLEKKAVHVVEKQSPAPDDPSPIQYINLSYEPKGRLPVKLTIGNKGKIKSNDKEIDIYKGNQLIVPFLSCEAILTKAVPTSLEKKAAYDFYPYGDFFVGIRKNHGFLLQEQSGDLLVAPFSWDHINRYAFIEKCREFAKEFLSAIQSSEGELPYYLTHPKMLEDLYKEFYPAFKSERKSDSIYSRYLEMSNFIRKAVQIDPMNKRPYLEAFFACLLYYTNGMSGSTSDELLQKGKERVEELIQYYSDKQVAQLPSTALIKQFQFIANEKGRIGEDQGIKNDLNLIAENEEAARLKYNTAR